jgi:hypothetical protein
MTESSQPAYETSVLRIKVQTSPGAAVPDGTYRRCFAPRPIPKFEDQCRQASIEQSPPANSRVWPASGEREDGNGALPEDISSFCTLLGRCFTGGKLKRGIQPTCFTFCLRAIHGACDRRAVEPQLRGCMFGKHGGAPPPSAG